MKQAPILVRKAVQSDVAFIQATWLRSFRSGAMVRHVPNRLYYAYHHLILDELLPKAIILIACDEEDPDTILGYIVAELVDTALVIHFMYVKKPFRLFGIARRLVELLIKSEQPPAVMYTHYTSVIGHIRGDNKDHEVTKWVYNPYLLFQRLPPDWADKSKDEIDPSNVQRLRPDERSPRRPSARRTVREVSPRGDGRVPTPVRQGNDGSSSTH